MTALGWLLIMIGIAALIEGAHGKTLWSGLNSWLSKSGSVAQAKG